MMYKYVDKEKFYNDFYKEIADVQCGNHYDFNNKQHIEWLKNKIRVEFLSGGKVLGAYEENGKPVGFIFYKHDKGLEGVSICGKKAVILMIEVVEEYRRKGIGKELIDRVCEEVRSNNAECLYTDTYAIDKDAIKFYITNDFIPVAVHEGEYGFDDYGQLYLYRKL